MTSVVLSRRSVMLSRRWSPEALKRDLERMRDGRSDAFVYYPGEGEIQHPPVSIWLAAWATDLAESLHKHHGWRVRLVVGNMQFPYLRLQGRQSLLTGWRFNEGATPMNPHEMTVSPEDPLVVQTGRKLHGHLILHNLDDRAVILSFDGQQEFTGIVVDPSSGAHVNGTFQAFDGREGQVEIAPGDSARTPLAIDTASSDPNLGYAVPPGTWDLQVVMRANGHRLLSPRLPLIVTAGSVASGDD